MMDEDNNEDNNRIVIVLILFVLVLIAFLIISNIIGKIGYVDTSSESTDIIEVTENDIGWDMLEELNIFRNKKYDYKNIIAPMSTGTYSFLVSNVTDKSLVYDLQLREINEYKVNMKYRLKLENVYVAGSKERWLDVNEVNLESVIIAPNSTNLYILEWYWEDNDKQDTIIGSLSYAEYTLRVKVGAQIYDKMVGEN